MHTNHTTYHLGFRESSSPENRRADSVDLLSEMQLFASRFLCTRPKEVEESAVKGGEACFFFEVSKALVLYSGV